MKWFGVPGSKTYPAINPLMRIIKIKKRMPGSKV
jgi:hypothetical protein